MTLPCAVCGPPTPRWPPPLPCGAPTSARARLKRRKSRFTLGSQSISRASPRTGAASFAATSAKG
eukprot:6098475-Lingulodinium_polyedra.AAC.1